MKTRRTSDLSAAAGQALSPLHAAGVRPAQPIALDFARSGRECWVATVQHEVEGVHFDPTFLSPFDLGTKSASTTLFQLAAAGIAPTLIQVNSGINQST